MRQWVALLCLWALAAPVHADVGTGINLGSLKVPASRLADWTKAGPLDGAGIPDTSGWTVTDVSCGGTDDATTIQNAINAAAANTVIRLPAGTCRIPSPKQIRINKSNLVLRGRGSGAGGTLVTVGVGNSGNCQFTGKGSIVACNDTALGGFFPLTGTFPRGTTLINIGTSGAFSVGDWALVAETSARQLTDQSKYSFSIDSDTPNTKNQIVHVTAVAGNTITFSPGLRDQYNSTEAPFVQKITMWSQIGLENFKMVHEVPGSDFTYCVVMQQVVNSWVTGMEFDKCPFAGGTLWRSAHVEIAHNILDDNGEITLPPVSGDPNSGCTSSGGPCVHGLWLWRGVHDSRLIDNAAIGKTQRLMTVDKGGASSGNVIGWNYGPTVLANENYTFGIFFHGGYSHANLIEGNVIPGQSRVDSFWGIHGPYNTWYRNRQGTAGDFQQTLALHHDSEVQPTLLTNYIANSVLGFGRLPFCTDLYRGGQCHEFDYTNPSSTHPGPEDIWLERNVSHDTRTAANTCTASGVPYACCTGAGTGSCNWGIKLIPVTGATGTHCGTGGDNDCTPSGNNVGTNVQRLLAAPTSADWASFVAPPSLSYTSKPGWWCDEAHDWSNAHAGVGAFGDNFAVAASSMPRIPSQILASRGTCTLTGSPAPPPVTPQAPPTISKVRVIDVQSQTAFSDPMPTSGLTIVSANHPAGIAFDLVTAGGIPERTTLTFDGSEVAQTAAPYSCFDTGPGSYAACNVGVSAGSHTLIVAVTTALGAGVGSPVSYTYTVSGSAPAPPPTLTLTGGPNYAERILGGGSPADTAVTTGGTIEFGRTPGGNTLRAAVRFPLPTIPAGATVTSIALRSQTVLTTGNSDTIKIVLYAGDPQADNTSTSLTRAAAGTPYVSTTVLRDNGFHDVDLGAQAVTDFLAASSTFSLGFSIATETGSNHTIEMTYNDMALVVGYTPAPADACHDGIDNDLDGLADANDPQCAGGGTIESEASAPVVCENPTGEQCRTLFPLKESECLAAFPPAAPPVVTTCQDIAPASFTSACVQGQTLSGERVRLCGDVEDGSGGISANERQGALRALEFARGWLATRDLALKLAFDVDQQVYADATFPAP